MGPLLFQASERSGVFDGISSTHRALHIVRLLRIPLLRISDSPLCIVSAYLRMIPLVPARRSCPVFLILGPKGLVHLTKRSFVFSRPGFPMPRVSGVILFHEDQPRGPLGAAFPGN